MFTVILDLAIAGSYIIIAIMQTDKWRKGLNAALALGWFLLAILNAIQSIVG